MKTPFYQQAAKGAVYLLLGFLTIGTFLDTLNSAKTLISPTVSSIGTIVILLLWISTEITLKIFKLRWKASGDQLVLLKSLGIKPRLALVGALLLLWIPKLLSNSHPTQHPQELSEPLSNEENEPEVRDTVIIIE